MQSRKTIWFCLFIGLIFLSAMPVLAQRPAVTVTPIWRPGEQLSTLGGDVRFVEVQLMMTGNVQFWAANIGCQFTPSVLTPVDLAWGPEWGTPGTDFVAVDSAGTGQFDYNSTNGVMTIRATRLGNVSPLGINGTDYNLLVATILLQVADLGSGLVNTASVVRCNPLDFYNRDGNLIVRGRQARVANLVVRSGYSITGQALLQASRTHAGITVSCDDDFTNPPAPYVTTTDSRGNYAFGSSGTPIRTFNEYECRFVSPITGADRAEFLDASTVVSLNFPTHYLLPVVLKGGNVSTIATSANDIDTSDLAKITTTWLPGTVANAYDGLDVNGDRRVNESDLAMFAGNYDDPGGGDASFIDASHMLFGLATDYGGIFPNSGIYWGDSRAGSVQLLYKSRRERDFWPAMSPDGEMFAYIETLPRSGQYMLYTSATGRPRGRALLNARVFRDDALAPSWSPDGQRIAFICSWKSDNSGHIYNEGNLCVVNADGSNFQQVATKSKIHPPAWFDNNVIIYAGLGDHPISNCQDNLCFFDLATNNHKEISAALLGDTDDIADMPAITSYEKTPDTYQTVLMYRFWNGSDNAILAREVGYDGSNFTPIGASSTVIASPNFVDYYDVGPLMRVVYTEYTITNGAFRTLDMFHNMTYNGGVLPGTWSTDGDGHTVDGFVGNPTATVGILAGQPWNGVAEGDSRQPTLFHAERATVEWIP